MCWNLAYIFTLPAHCITCSLKIAQIIQFNKHLFLCVSCWFHRMSWEMAFSNEKNIVSPIQGFNLDQLCSYNIKFYLSTKNYNYWIHSYPLGTWGCWTLNQRRWRWFNVATTLCVQRVVCECYLTIPGITFTTWKAPGGLCWRIYMKTTSQCIASYRNREIWSGLALELFIGFKLL